jgi:uncharacterized membrane protein YciS (DUF1049 family)
MSCPYKDALGVPGEGFHSVRFMDVAVGDTVGTVALAWLLAQGFKWNFWTTLLVLFVLGEILHWYFCVDTTVIKFLKGI